MRSLDIPIEDAVEYFKKCVSKTQYPVLREELLLCESTFKKNAENYFRCAEEGKLCHVKSDIEVTSLDAEIKSLYKTKVVQKGAVGRYLYDYIIMSSPNDICPMCGVRIVRTIDHYLPKGESPSFSVLPINLLPCCRDCNSDKDEFVPCAEDEQLIHPYFDKIEGEKWLRANVEYIKIGISLQFYVSPPPIWSSVLSNRVSGHFKKMGVAALTRTYGLVEINNIRSKVSRVLASSGPSGVKAYLHDQWETCSDSNINSWQSATYEALENSDEFCSGRFS